MVLSILALGCAREAVPPGAPRMLVAAPGYAWPPTTSTGRPPSDTWTVARGPDKPPAELPAPRSQARVTLPLPKLTPATLPPAGAQCLARLTELGVAYESVDHLRGVSTPVVVKSDIGGLHFVAGAGLPLELDCRFAVALAEVAPILTHLGVTALRFSGAYVYRQSRVGKLSLHANGLAIDVHAMKVASGWVEVKKDFSRGLSDGCAVDAPVLNRVACELKRTGRFKELLTPDYNADHHDHIHLAIARTGEEPDLNSI